MFRMVWFFCLILVFQAGAQPEQARLKVMSFNIRYDNPDDAENAWPNRTPIILQTLKRELPEIIGFQEVLFHQLTFLDSALQDYCFYGVGRRDGKTGGEFSPIFFKKDRFLLKTARTFWLSEHPEQEGSIGPGAQLPRILTLIQLYDRQSDQDFWVGNTHFSHVSDTARLLAARTILTLAKQLCQNEAFVLLGDFNASQSGKVYRLMVSDRVLHLADSYFLSNQKHSGGQQTFNAFGKNSQHTIIDHIFCTPHFKVLKHYYLPVKKGATFISDHYPVVTVLQFKSN